MIAKGGDAADETAIRLDRWLHFARLFKTRTAAADAIIGGGVRLNGQPCRKPAHILRNGDVLTVSRGGHVRVLRVLRPGARRGPASEAVGLYEEIAL